MIRVAINGYGRIGRISHRVLLEHFTNQATVVAINTGSSTDVKGWMYLLKYDSVYGTLNKNITCQTAAGANGSVGTISIDGQDVQVFSQKDPSSLPWKDLQVDVVIECTGDLLTEEALKAHLAAGAKKVVLSAPAKDETTTYMLSVNADEYKGEEIISNASCTTNCIAPVTKVLMDTFGIEKAMLTTIHAYTSDQRLHDGGHKDYRRARAAGLNIVPTSTGATKAVTKAIPALEKKFTGFAIRVPVPVGSLSDTTYLLSKEVTVDEVNDAFKNAAESDAYKGILGVSEEPLVSSDIVGSSYSAIVDLSLTQVVGNMVKVVSWYDNEYGYAHRLVEEAVFVSK